MKCFVLVFAVVGVVLSTLVSGVTTPSKKKLRHVTRMFEDDFLTEGANCTKQGDYGYPRCRPGTWCLGNPGKCAYRADLGGDCSDDPFRCGDELRCEDGKCVDVLLMLGMYVDYGERCGVNAYQRCFPGFWCVAGACRRLIRCGGRCDNVRRVCRPGLACHYLYSMDLRICRPVQGSESIRFAGESCIVGGDKCITGLVCAVRNGVGTCLRPERIGEECGGEQSDCESGRECQNVYDTMRCVQMMTAGQHCDADKYLLCSSGLTCTDKKCA